MWRWQWSSAADPRRMLEFLRGKISERKVRLLGCAVSYRYARLFPDDWYPGALGIAEQFADDRVVTPEVEAAREHAAMLFDELRARYFPPGTSAQRSFFGGSVTAAQNLVALLSDGSPLLKVPISLVWFATAAYPLREPGEPLPDHPQGADRAGRAAIEADLATYPNLIREVVGDPFRRREVPSSCRSAEVVAAAEMAYRNGRFDVLPELADLLERAGCRDAELVRHCRNPNGHVRGCWALDLLLGRA